MDMSRLSEFEQLLREVGELSELVPDYLEHEKEKRIERIKELSSECYHVYKN